MSPPSLITDYPCHTLADCRETLALVLAENHPLFELSAPIREFGAELLRITEESALQELLEFRDPSVSLTVKILVRPSQDRLQVEAYMTAGPLTPPEVKFVMPPDYFELLSIAGFSVLIQSPTELQGYPLLQTADAAACNSLHGLLMDLIRLEVENCETLARASFLKVTRVLPSAASPYHEFLPAKFARIIGGPAGGPDACH